MSAARISPGRRREVGTANWLIARLGGRVGGTMPPHLFLTMGRQRRLFRGWLRFAGRLMPRGTLPRRDTELVILRVAALNGCEYELHHHRRMGARVGLSETDISRVTAHDPGGWPARTQALLAAVDCLHAARDLDDDTWQQLRQHLDESAVVEFLLLVGHYQMLATFIRTLRVQTDEPTAVRSRS
jgi:AhpD family alkylhydroperoxidase